MEPEPMETEYTEQASTEPAMPAKVHRPNPANGRHATYFTHCSSLLVVAHWRNKGVGDFLAVQIEHQNYGDYLEVASSSFKPPLDKHAFICPYAFYRLPPLASNHPLDNHYSTLSNPSKIKSIWNQFEHYLAGRVEIQKDYPVYWISHWEASFQAYRRRSAIRLLPTQKAQYALFIILTTPDKSVDDPASLHIPLPAEVGKEKYLSDFVSSLKDPNEDPIYGMPRILSFVTAKIVADDYKGQLKHQFVDTHVIPALKAAVRENLQLS